jgi:hypothetical protein
MNSERRGVTNLRTMAGLVDGRRKRTSYGALLELSMLEMEKERLAAEVLRTALRTADINKRLAEIDSKKVRLLKFVDKPPVGAHSMVAAESFPTFTVQPSHARSRRLSY